MDNRFILTARLSKTDILRYTPSGVPVLEVELEHESQQTENGLPCTAKFTISGRILGREAEIWQYRQGDMVDVAGFLCQRSINNPRPVLRIQNIQIHKG